MTLKAVSPDASTSGKAARGSAAAAPRAGGAAGAGKTPHADAAHTGTPDGAAPGAGASDGPRAQAGDAPPDATMTLRAVRPDGAAPGAEKPGAAATGTPSPDDRTSVLPTPLAPGTARPHVDDLGLFDDATRPLRAVSAGAAVPRPEAAAPRNRHRRGALIAASGAVVAVLGAAGWASGLFSYDTPSRDTAAPGDVRASVPDAASAAPSTEPSSEAPSAFPSASASASDSPSASASGSPSPSASSSAPSASATAEPSVTPSAGAESSAPAAAPEPEEPADTAPVLRRGDRGPEVVELQQRLRRVWLYQGDLNGQYNHRVEEAVRHYQWSRGINEELGVYGPQTRSRLESET
ncbi:peptidoglycan-binding protein [Streptomyces albogriseolus]|uniref:peptidoglycan-binding protein n=1 Tax=Streptomyces albogriseolus TaxID=1887 RepID=UPI0033A9032A